MSYVIHVHPQYGYRASGYGHRSYGGYGGYGGYSSYGIGSMRLVGDGGYGGYGDYAGYPRVGSDGLTTQQRTFLRRSRRAVARQTYLANAGLRSALAQSDMMAASPILGGYSQAMVGGMGYGYGAAAYTPYAGAYAYPGYAYAGVNTLAAYQPVVPFWG